MPNPVAVLAAMEQEILLVEARLTEPSERVVGGRRCVTGTLSGRPVVTVISGFGKVAAAATIATVLDSFSPTHVVFGGVAGGIASHVKIGDVVIADGLVQHDFDARPIFDRFVIPSLGIAEIPTDPHLTEQLVAAAGRYLNGPFQREVTAKHRLLFDVDEATVHKGLIASGDRFIDNSGDARALLDALPSLLAVEMEGAAIAQVCAERGVPYAVFRSVSDRADQHAAVDFQAFITTVAAPITAGVVKELLSSLS